MGKAALKEEPAAVEIVVTQSKVRDIIKEQEMNCAGDFAEALSSKVIDMVVAACARAKSNDRKTVRPGDL